MALEALKIKKTEKELSDEDSFRIPIKDVIEFATKLSAICNSIEEMTQLCQLALTNDAQCRILMQLIGTEEK